MTEFSVVRFSVRHTLANLRWKRTDSGPASMRARRPDCSFSPTHSERTRLLLPRPLSHLGSEMDVIPMCSIFQELQIVHDTGYFSALPSLEEYWQQVTRSRRASVLLRSKSARNVRENGGTLR